jgi:hypothetical protein
VGINGPYVARVSCRNCAWVGIGRFRGGTLYVRLGFERNRSILLSARQLKHCMIPSVSLLSPRKPRSALMGCAFLCGFMRE